MPRVCFIRGCRTHKDYYERGVAMFSFPKEPNKRAAWNEACSREANYEPPGYACICEKHFDPTAVFRAKTSAGKTLRMDVAPTRFLDGWKPSVDKNLEVNLLRPVVDNVLLAEELDDVPHVEEVLIKENPYVVPEVPTITANMFCRMCGIKHEKSHEYDLNELQNDQNDSMFKFFLLNYDELLPARTICPECHDQIDSIIRFSQKCHEGQLKLLEQLSELKQIPIPAYEDDAIRALYCDTESEDSESNYDAPKLTDEDFFETEETKNARMDKYIDTLMLKYKSAKGRSRVAKSWECLDCRQVFQHRTHLRKHRRTCSLVGTADSKRQGPFRCELCDKLLNTLPGYRYHLLRKHDNKEDDNHPDDLRLLKSNKVLTCPICKDSFATAYKLRYHLPSHRSTNQGRGYESNRSSMPRDSACMCSVCGKMERSPAGLQIHMKFHLKQKDWQCDQCDKQYYTKADLKQHVLVVHDKVTYPCEICGLVLKSQATFTRHKRVHDVSLQKQCSFCTKKFTTTNALNKHVHARHQGWKRPQMHDIELPEDMGNHEEGHTDLESEEIIEEVVIVETSNFTSRDDIKLEPIMFVPTSSSTGK